MATYPLVDRSTPAQSAARIPLNTTLFELIVPLVLPSYTLLSAVMPEMIVTAAFPIAAVNPAGCVSA